jgi:hypothetical protein
VAIFTPIDVRFYFAYSNTSPSAAQDGSRGRVADGIFRVERLSWARRIPCELLDGERIVRGRNSDVNGRICAKLCIVSEIVEKLFRAIVEATTERKKIGAQHVAPLR